MEQLRVAACQNLSKTLNDLLSLIEKRQALRFLKVDFVKLESGHSVRDTANQH